MHSTENTRMYKYGIEMKESLVTTHPNKPRNILIQVHF